MSFRFIHTADLHLGSPFKGLKQIPERLKNQIVQSTFEAFRSIVNRAVQDKADFIVISGDIFDQSHRSIQTQLQFKQEMERLHQAHIQCYIIHGNHDPLDGDFIDLKLPPNVVVFPAFEVNRETFIKNGEEMAHIYGISYETAKVTRNLSSLFMRQNQDVFSIGLLHTNCEGAQEHENYAPCSKQDLLQAGFDYWALGHVHQRKILHQHPYIVYPGNIQGRHIREQGEKGYYVIDVEHNQVMNISFQHVQQFIWLERDIDLSAVETVDELIQNLEQFRRDVSEEYQGQAVIIRLRGVGASALAHTLAQKDFTQSILDHVHDNKLSFDTKSALVWLESFTFYGTAEFQREELQLGEGMLQDILKIIDGWTNSENSMDEEWKEINKELVEHYRVKQVLEPFSPAEQKEIIKQAEAIFLREWLGDKNS